MRLYLTGQLFSLCGDTMLFLAMAIWVKSLTGSSAAAGLTVFFIAAPAIAAPLAGLLVDRVRRRPLLITVNVVLAAAVLPLLWVHDATGVWLIYLVMLAYGTGRLLLSSAQAALLPALVGDDLLGDANSALSLISNGLRLIGPLAGAGLFAVTGPHVVVLIDSATFLVAAVTLIAIRVAEPAPHPGGERWAGAVAGGVRFLWSTPVLRQLVTAFVLGFAVIGLIETLVFSVVAALQRPPAFLGVLVSAQGVGAIAAGLTAARLMRKSGESRVAAGGLLACSLGIGGLIIPRTTIDVAAMVVLGAGITATAIGANTLIQRRTPTHLLGRVDAAAEVAVTVPQTMFIGIGAALVAVISYQLLLAATATLMLLSGTWLLTRPARQEPATRTGAVRAEATTPSALTNDEA